MPPAAPVAPSPELLQHLLLDAMQRSETSLFDIDYSAGLPDGFTIHYLGGKREPTSHEVSQMRTFIRTVSRTLPREEPMPAIVQKQHREEVMALKDAGLPGYLIAMQLNRSRSSIYKLIDYWGPKDARTKMRLKRRNADRRRVPKR